LLQSSVYLAFLCFLTLGGADLPLRGPNSCLGPGLLACACFPLALPVTIAATYRILSATSPISTAPVAEEYQVKGAFLLNFAKFVSWPDQAFKSPEDPIAICILGQNPFGPGLEQAARELVIGDRHVVIRQSSDVQSARQCQIVFVAVNEKKLAKALLQAAQGESVLTVGEFEGFTAGGGIIAFKLDGDKVRLDINTAAADRARLHISAKLLSLAQSAHK